MLVDRAYRKTIYGGNGSSVSKVTEFFCCFFATIVSPNLFLGRTNAEHELLNKKNHIRSESNFFIGGMK